MVHCCTLDAGDVRRLVSAIDELAQELQRHYPQILPIAAAPLEPLDAGRLLRHLQGAMPGGPPDRHEDAEFAGLRLLVLCREEHPFVSVARAENPRAHWGIGVPCRFSAAWVENKYLWWHEALHLFNAKDCYNPFGIHKCPEPHCIMQSSPAEWSCGGRLYLCSKNVRRLSEALEA